MSPKVQISLMTENLIKGLLKVDVNARTSYDTLFALVLHEDFPSVYLRSFDKP